MKNGIIRFITDRLPIMRRLGLMDEVTTDKEYVSVAEKMMAEQEYKNIVTDKQIDYNDEICEIEFLGELETIDISVTGDSLFYCNDILTKNSIGLAATADLICSLWREEEDIELGVINMGIQKNRFGPNFGSAAFKCNYNTLTLKETNSDYFEADADSSEDNIKNADRALNNLIE
jgi:hypothetical protein